MSSKIPTPKRLTKSIRLDGVNPRDYFKYDFRFACEDCSHFNSETGNCTIGYHTKHHRKAEQQRLYELCGKFAVCRFLEID